MDMVLADWIPLVGKQMLFLTKRPIRPPYLSTCLPARLLIHITCVYFQLGKNIKDSEKVSLGSLTSSHLGLFAGFKTPKQLYICKSLKGKSEKAALTSQRTNAECSPALDSRMCNVSVG